MRTGLWVVMGALCIGGCALETATSGRIAVGEPGTQVAAGRFSAHDRKLIEDYYRSHLAAAARGAWPAGVGYQRPLPSGVRTQPLPASLSERLAPLSSRFSRLRVEGVVVLLDRDTRVVLDIVSIGD